MDNSPPKASYVHCIKCTHAISGKEKLSCKKFPRFHTAPNQEIACSYFNTK